MWRDVASLSENQHGMVAWWQLERLGLTWPMVEHLAAKGRLVRVRPTVYRVSGAPVGRLGVLVSATLASRNRAVVTRRTAAVDLWGVPDVSRTSAVELLALRPVDLSLPRTHLSTTNHLPRADTTTRFGIPTVTYARLVVELAAVLRAAELARVLDFGLRRRILRLPDFTSTFERWQRPGRRGLVRLQTLLAARSGAYRVPDSDWEGDAYERLLRTGLPPGERWYRVDRPNGRPAWIDVAYPASKVALELDSFEWHGQRTFFDDDADGRADLGALGWLVIPHTSAISPATTVARVRRALASRAA
jgi:hypothetical protein